MIKVDAATAPQQPSMNSPQESSSEIRSMFGSLSTKSLSDNEKDTSSTPVDVDFTLAAPAEAKSSASLAHENMDIDETSNSEKQTTPHKRKLLTQVINQVF